MTTLAGTPQSSLLLALSAWRWLARLFSARLGQGQDLEARRRCVASRCAVALMVNTDHWDQQLRIHGEGTTPRGRRAHRLGRLAVRSPPSLFVSRSLCDGIPT